MKSISQRTVCADTLWEGAHESGLRVFVYPKAHFSSSYALFGTRYGSIDNVFRRAGDAAFTEVPAGIAHYLEHKLFENEDEDAFARYARTGANANAYTSFEKTCYLFSCTKHFTESLEILLDFVQKPYFTPETVQKEQGIIAQEIRMGDDDPDSKVFWNLLKAMYRNHPVRIDIAGTVESIAQIDADLLYRCYRTFYHPSNMVLCAAGNVNPDEVFALVDRMVPAQPAPAVERQFPAEPAAVVQARVTDTAPVAAPLFTIGFKESADVRPTDAECAATDVLLQVLASDTSPLYRRLMAGGWINDSFSAEYFEGSGYAAVLFGGESRDPDYVAAEIVREADRLRREGIDPESFECARRALYGSAVSGFGSVSLLANRMADAALSGRTFGAEPELLRAMTVQQVQDRLAVQLLPDRMAISVVNPLESTNQQEG